MSIQEVVFDQISEAHINELISNAVPENARLEYKQQSYGPTDADKREFLADISALANTQGGDIIIGVTEQNGIPGAIQPIQSARLEAQRLQNIAQSGLEPRLPDIRVRTISVNGGEIIVVRTSSSFTRPHRVISQGSNRFFARAGAAKYEPDVQQLRILFNEGQNIFQRIKEFQIDRVLKISAGDMPVGLGGTAKVAIHMVPVPAFGDGRMADAARIVARGSMVPFSLVQIDGGVQQQQVNLDGYLHSISRHPIGPIGYAQLFRNGAIEAVGLLRADGPSGPRFVTQIFTDAVVSRVKQYLKVFSAYELGVPVYVFLSICNAAQLVWRHSDGAGGYLDTDPVGREIVTVPEVYIDSFDVDVIDVMEPALNAIWNAVGQIQCDRYSDKAKWKSQNPYDLKP